MFRFDHDASPQGVGGRGKCSRQPIHRSVNLLRMNASRHWRFTGPARRDARAGFGLARKNQMSD